MDNTQVHPQFAMYANIAVSILSFLTTAGAVYTTMFGQGAAQKIVAGVGFASGLVTAINAGLHGYSSPAPGVLVQSGPSTPPAA